MTSGERSSADRGCRQHATIEYVAAHSAQRSRPVRIGRVDPDAALNWAEE
jgi:hypothetical protein